MKRWTMILLVACAWPAAKASVEITVTGDPPLPVRNLLEADNPGFEQGFAKWRCDLETHRTNGLLVKLSGDAAVGTNALHVDTRNALPSLNLGWGGGNFSLSRTLSPPEKLFEEGKPYVLSCLAQSEATGSGYSGVSLGHYLEGWKAVPWGERIEAVAVVRGPTQGKWRRFTSEPFTYRKGALPTFFTLSVGVVYERNALRFDEIGLYPAFSELLIHVKGRDLLQVAVEDDRGAIVYSSKVFTEPDVNFSATVRVSAVGRYRVKTVDKQGDVVVQDYPDLPPALTVAPGLYITGVEAGISTVAVSRTASALERDAAQEAVRIIGRLTGVTPTLLLTNALSAKGMDGMLIIGSSLTEDTALAAKLAVLRDGYVVQTSGGRIIVAGTDPYYTLQGVYRFFTRLGCAFFVRHDSAFWEDGKKYPAVESYPQGTRFAVGAGWSEKPRFAYLGEAKRGNPRATRERKAGVYGHMWSHTADLLVPYSVYGKIHPEYYALRPDGKRLVSSGSMTVHLCMSNLDVQRIAAENVINWIDQQPEREYFDVIQGDGADWCVCEACKALDVKGHGSSDRLMFFVNRVAKKVAERYPDKKLVFLSYTPYSESPPAHYRPAANVSVLFAPYCWGGAHSQFHPLTHAVNGTAWQNFRGWMKILAPDQMIGFEYPKVYPYALYPDGALKASVANIRTYAAEPAVHAVRYCGTPISFGDLHRYILGELHWSPGADEQRLVDAFSAEYYGAAAPQMRQYLDLLEETVESTPHFQRCEYYAPGLLDTGLSEKVYPVFKIAEKAVVGAPIRLKRVREEKACLLFVDLYERNPANGREKNAERFAGKLQEFLRIGSPLKLGQSGLTARRWLMNICGLETGNENIFDSPVVRGLIAAKDPAGYLASHASLAKAKPDGKRLNLAYFNQTVEYLVDGKPVRALFVQAPGTGKECATGVIEWIDNPWNAVLRLTGLDENAPLNLGLKITFNDQDVYSGIPDFPVSEWKNIDIPVPSGALQYGHNRITITSVGSTNAADGNKRLLIKEVRLLY